MKPDYRIGQRLAFIARNSCTVEGRKIYGKWTHYVGYVKQIRRRFFHVRYVVILPKSADIFIVPQRDIIGVVERKEENSSPNN